MTWNPFPDASDERTLVMTRTFRAPRLLVWRCFEDPELLRQWWGPENFTIPELSLDFRPGGRWHVTIRHPDGTDFPVNYTFEDIVPPERLVYRNALSTGSEWAGKAPARYIATLTFEATGDSETLLTLRFAFGSAAEKEDSVTRGFGRGIAEALGKLERFVDHQT